MSKRPLPSLLIEVADRSRISVADDMTLRFQKPMLNINAPAMGYDDALRLRNWLNDFLGQYNPVIHIGERG